MEEKARLNFESMGDAPDEQEIGDDFEQLENEDDDSPALDFSESMTDGDEQQAPGNDFILDETEALDVLQAEWGPVDVQYRVNCANRVLEEFGSDEDFDLLSRHQLGNSPLIIKELFEIYLAYEKFFNPEAEGEPQLDFKDMDHLEEQAALDKCKDLFNKARENIKAAAIKRWGPLDNF